MPIYRCRDEGPRRLKVHWARADGRPLKSGHSDHRGRLTLPRVTEDDAGVYLCVPLSVDGQELRPSQKSATLVVTARVYPPTHALIYPFSRIHDPRYLAKSPQNGTVSARRQRRQRYVAAVESGISETTPSGQAYAQSENYKDSTENATGVVVA